MKRKFFLVLVAVVFALVSAASVTAGETAGQKTVIALKTDDFEMAETDISDLEVGEAETIVTDSGKTIDLLRTAEGVEVYVDGELMEMGFDDEAGMHGEHGTVHKRVKVICNDDGDCEKTVWVSDGEDLDIEALHGEEGEHRIIRKRIEIECDAGDDCEAIDIESLDGLGDTHGVIMIDMGKGGEMEIFGDEAMEIHSGDHDGKVHVIRKKVRKN